jgi:hypothetical protein
MFGVFAAPTARIKAIDKTRNEWVDRTGELPPDFDAPPKQPFLPDAFDGVRTREDWTRRRPEIRGSIEKCITGRMPPAPEQCSRHRDNRGSRRPCAAAPSAAFISRADPIYGSPDDAKDSSGRDIRSAGRLRCSAPQSTIG